MDGCVDMGMEKHLLAFGAASVCHYGLQPIQNVAMKAWMYVNFFSMDRGVSRFVTLYKWADIVNSTRAASSLGLSAPDFKYLRRWASAASALSPEALSAFIESGDAAPILEKGESAEEAFAELSSVLEWSGRVNALVPEATAHMRAFPNAVAAIQEGYARGVDYAIVSGTPQSHIETMAAKYGIADCLEALWGQQAGRKSHGLVTMMIGQIEREELEAAIEEERPLLESREPQYDVLTMVGDAPKDNAERMKANLALSGSKDGTDTHAVHTGGGGERGMGAFAGGPGRHRVGRLVAGGGAAADRRRAFQAGCRVAGVARLCVWRKRLSVRAPDFFIVGAPKCGTTSLHRYLQAHPQLFLPERKELPYLASDLTDQRDGMALSDEAYHGHFRGAGSRIAGASWVMYLYSKRAATELRAFSPDARILVLLRNPVEMLYSYHSQLLTHGLEEIENFEEALDAEAGTQARQASPQLASVP